MTGRTIGAATCERPLLLNCGAGPEVDRRERLDRLDRLDNLARRLVLVSRVLLAALAAMVVLSELVRAATP